MWSNPITIKPELGYDLLNSVLNSTFRYGALSKGIDKRKPTLFITTITYYRLGRLNLLRRLAAAIRHHQIDNQILCDRSGGRTKTCRQFIWILCEDDKYIDKKMIDLLDCSRIPYVYFAYGPTKRHGSAQKNAVLEYIVNLTHDFRFTASIHPIDDDCYTLPDAFNFFYNIKKVSLIPVVGLGPDGIEYAITDKNHMIKEMRAGLSNRTFPVDYNALGWSTTIFDKMWRNGQHMYWPFPGWAGETEFLELYLKRLNEIYVPCNMCKTIFYNRPVQDTDILLTCPTLD
ncbi:unnamed protein product [Adineta ricciae]|uniref:Galactosylgalactosylxylosylprotein 3-beta-glucuronosyltransferase n=1 Tax=Adineta ricciae TaxID=249248 RepID=A0A814RFJ2_ADIRI|nr:unnamed protein product [Adineta ricciae]CAF1394672.1 unnamed protein product [Adineta ricciae]